MASYGLFQAHFMAIGLASAASIAWIGSLQAFLVLAVAPVCGALFDVGHARATVVAGTVLVVLGTVAASATASRPQFWAQMLAQGVVTGIGLGLLFTPALTLVPTYFHRHRVLAVGVASSGAGLGGVLYPIVVRWTLAAYGLGWALRAMAAGVVLTQLLPCTLLRQRMDIVARAGQSQQQRRREPRSWRAVLPPGGTGGAWDPRMFRALDYSVLCAGAFIVFLGLMTPYFFVTAWAGAYFGGAPHSGLTLGFPPYYLIAIMNAGGTFGRIIPAHVAGHTCVFHQPRHPS